jgi:hypothetical protein
VTVPDPTEPTDPTDPVAAAAPAVAVVETARARLGELDALPVAAHPAVYDEVHDVLQGTLAGLGW